MPVYYVLAPAEASSNLSRFDGVRYGYRAPEYSDLTDMYEKSRAQGFGAEVKRRIMIGTYVLSHGYYDAYYLQAQKIRRLIAQDFAEAFKQCDVIMGPTSPSTAFKLGEKGDDPVQMYLSDIYTIAVNLAGLPGMSIPCGFGSERPARSGLQIIGNYFDEARMLNVAHQYQLATDWHESRAAKHRAVRNEHDMGNRHRAGSAYPALDQQQDILGRLHHLWRRAEHAGGRGEHRAARRAAGAEQGRGGTRDQVRPRDRRAHRAALGVRAQELFLSRPAQGLPDQPVRPAGGGAGRADDTGRAAVRPSTGSGPSPTKKWCASPAPIWKKTRASRCTRISTA